MGVSSRLVYWLHSLFLLPVCVSGCKCHEAKPKGRLSSFLSNPELASRNFPTVNLPNVIPVFVCVLFPSSQLLIILFCPFYDPLSSPLVFLNSLTADIISPYPVFHTWCAFLFPAPVRGHEKHTAKNKKQCSHQTCPYFSAFFSREMACFQKMILQKKFSPPKQFKNIGVSRCLLRNSCLGDTSYFPLY